MSKHGPQGAFINYGLWAWQAWEGDNVLDPTWGGGKDLLDLSWGEGW